MQSWVRRNVCRLSRPYVYYLSIDGSTCIVPASLRSAICCVRICGRPPALRMKLLSVSWFYHNDDACTYVRLREGLTQSVSVLPPSTSPLRVKGKRKRRGQPLKSRTRLARLPVLISYYGIIDVGFQVQTTRVTCSRDTGIRRKRLVVRHANSCLGSLWTQRYCVTNCLSSFVLSGKSNYDYYYIDIFRLTCICDNFWGI